MTKNILDKKATATGIFATSTIAPKLQFLQAKRYK